MVTTKLIDSAVEAGEYLRSGKLVAFPTETVYGLGVDARNPSAIARLFEAKGRPSDNPLIVHLATVTAWSQAARQMSESAQLFLAAYSPGPITVVLPKSDAISSEVCAGLDTVGLRIPNCELALEVLRNANCPIAAPSANRSGRPSCTTWRAVMEDLDGRVDAVLKGQVSELGLESTVVDCCGETPVLLRSGAITLEQLKRVVPTTRTLVPASDDDRRRKSPGLNHPHYQPRARVYLFESSEQLSQLIERATGKIAIGVIENSEPSNFVAVNPAAIVLYQEFSSVELYAHGFYEFLRQADRMSAAVVCLQLATSTGIGSALRDRQQRAAGSLVT